MPDIPNLGNSNAIKNELDETNHHLTDISSLVSSLIGQLRENFMVTAKVLAEKKDEESVSVQKREREIMNRLSLSNLNVDTRSFISPATSKNTQSLFNLSVKGVLGDTLNDMKEQTIQKVREFAPIRYGMRAKNAIDVLRGKKPTYNENNYQANPNRELSQKELQEKREKDKDQDAIIDILTKIHEALTGKKEEKKKNDSPTGGGGNSLLDMFLQGGITATFMRALQSGMLAKLGPTVLAGTLAAAGAALATAFVTAIVGVGADAIWSYLKSSDKWDASKTGKIVGAIVSGDGGILSYASRMFAGMVAGGWAGAKLGAMAGSFLGPGGSIIGSIAGILIGGAVGIGLAAIGGETVAQKIDHMGEVISSWWEDIMSFLFGEQGKSIKEKNNSRVKEFVPITDQEVSDSNDVKVDTQLKIKAREDAQKVRGNVLERAGLKEIQGAAQTVEQIQAIQDNNLKVSEAKQVANVTRNASTASSYDRDYTALGVNRAVVIQDNEIATQQLTNLETTREEALREAQEEGLKKLDEAISGIPRENEMLREQITYKLNEETQAKIEKIELNYDETEKELKSKLEEHEAQRLALERRMREIEIESYEADSPFSLKPIKDGISWLTEKATGFFRDKDDELEPLPEVRKNVPVITQEQKQDFESYEDELNQFVGFQEGFLHTAKAEVDESNKPVYRDDGTRSYAIGRGMTRVIDPETGKERNVLPSDTMEYLFPKRWGENEKKYQERLIAQGDRQMKETLQTFHAELSNSTEIIEGSTKPLGVIFNEIDSPVRKMALLDMYYQMGGDRFETFDKTIRLIEQANGITEAIAKQNAWAKVADEAKRSKWYRQTPNRAENVLNALRDGSQLSHPNQKDAIYRVNVHDQSISQDDRPEGAPGAEGRMIYQPEKIAVGDYRGIENNPEVVIPMNALEERVLQTVKKMSEIKDQVSERNQSVQTMAFEIKTKKLIENVQRIETRIRQKDDLKEYGRMIQTPAVNTQLVDNSSTVSNHQSVLVDRSPSNQHNPFLMPLT